ncbi:MAG: PHP-associated domain-containing protein [Nanoarchaeota archaeon]|nr:PHP-associated domain-containing protein [Nanoarchaeota archaeon]
MKLDFHVHTKYSNDSLMSLETFNKVCKKRGLFPVITDHDTIKGAVEYKRRFGDCIIGEEIHTLQGDLTGIFLNEQIPAKIDVHEAVDIIREQGALVYIPHPFDIGRMSTLKVHDFKADIVEVFNARVVLQKYNRMANEYAEKHGLLKAVGSDSHFSSHVGICYAEMDSFDDIKGFKESLRKARLVTKSVNPLALGLTNVVHFSRKRVEMLQRLVSLR